MANCSHGGHDDYGALDVRDSQALRVRYQDETAGSPDPNKLRKASATAVCRVRAQEIVVATNAWMSGWRPVRGRLTNFGSYVANMTMYADIRFSGVVFPVIGWWAYDILYITPFVSIPYLHTVNREIFTD